MAEGFSAAAANATLAALLQGTSFSLAQAWVKFHIGAPGAAGTSNPAGETRRVQCTTKFGTAPASGVIVNDAAIGPLTSVSTTEVWSHWSLWDASTAGAFWFSGTLTGGSVTIGDTVTISSGAMTVTVPIAS